MNGNLNIDDKIKLANEFCNMGYINNMSEHFKYLYPFATENIAGYMPLLNMDNRSLLTVGSSGDQVLNAILHGCNDICVVDICPFTKEYFYLKLAALMSLNKEKFLKFICYKNYQFAFFSNKNAFDTSVYKIVRNSILDDEVKYFWDNIFEVNRSLKIRKGLFNPDEYQKKLVFNINDYLKIDVASSVIADKIKKVNLEFICDDIFKVNIDRMYDNINLSNLISYYSIYEIKDLFYKFQSILNDMGKIIIGYLYNTTINTPYREVEDEVYNLPLTMSLFPADAKIESFLGTNGILFNNITINDSVLTYKKVKKM